MCFCLFIGFLCSFNCSSVCLLFWCISSDGEELWDINTLAGVTWMDPSPSSVLDSDHSREMQCSGGDYWVKCPKSHYLGTWGGVMFVIVVCVFKDLNCLVFKDLDWNQKSWIFKQRPAIPILSQYLVPPGFFPLQKKQHCSYFFM